MMHNVVFLTMMFIILSAYMDYEHLSDNDFIEDHKSRWLLRLSFFLTMGLIDIRFFFGSSLLFAAIFDQTLNKLMGDKFFHLGTTAKWDKFFRKSIFLYVGAKIAALITAFLFFFDLYVMVPINYLIDLI